MACMGSGVQSPSAPQKIRLILFYIMLLGVHVSTQGKIYEALERARELGCDTMQIFSRNPQAWRRDFLAPQDINEFIQRQEKLNIKPKQTIVFDDLIRGEISFQSENIDDQVLIKSDGYPTYHLAVVVDDH